MEQNDLLSDITTALASSETNSEARFCVEYALKPSDIEVTVAEVGKMDLPLTAEKLQAFINVSSQAKFGRREQTLLDEGVRHTQELHANQLTVKYNEVSFKNMLDAMRETLGLPTYVTLGAHLHNMLIYGPEQFFKPHQDSEKMEGMVASLVIILPSAHIGGELRIQHRKSEYNFESEQLYETSLKCIAFYADCIHEVAPVKQGYRVALTYNLVLEQKEIQLPTYHNTQLEAALARYFTEDEMTEPQVLAFFLDHSYSQHGLRWDLLKETDSQNALAFRQAAETLGLIPHLALVEIRENWSTEGGYHYDDDNEGAEPIELIDSDCTMSYWLDSNGQELAYGSYQLDEDNICWIKSIDTLEPDEAEYEGWMGNYGNTVDYWYRRAAVILWRKTDQTAMTFKLDYRGALTHMLELFKNPKSRAEGMDLFHKAGDALFALPSWYAAKYLDSFMDIACYIQDKNLALTLLQPFNLSMLELPILEGFAKLEQQYGTDWALSCMEILRDNAKHERGPFKDIDKLGQQMQALGISNSVINIFLDEQITRIIAVDQRLTRAKPLEVLSSLKSRLNDFQGAMQICQTINNKASSQRLIQHIIANPMFYPELELAEWYTEFMHTNNFVISALKVHIWGRITEALKVGLRKKDDWSISVKLSCDCKHCKIAKDFLSSSIEQQKVWPIAGDIRQHIATVFHGVGLPVILKELKQGSPYKLVLTKDTNLHHQDKIRFQALTRYERILA